MEETNKKSEQSKKKVSSLWITSTDGKSSLSATFALISFVATTLAYVTSIVESVGDIKFRAFDVGACGAYMVPILSLYFGRRWIEKTSKKEE